MLDSLVLAFLFCLLGVVFAALISMVRQNNKPYREAFDCLKVSIGNVYKVKAISKDNIALEYRGRHVDLSLAKMKSAYFGIHLSLAGSFPKQKRFMVSYPSVAPNVSWQGDKLYSLIVELDIKPGTILLREIEQQLHAMLTAAIELESKNA